MSTRYICDYEGCGREAVCRIIEERYDKPRRCFVWLGLDACDVHRTVTHPGWWCRDHEEVLRQQALRDVREVPDDVPDFGVQWAYTKKDGSAAQ